MKSFLQKAFKFILKIAIPSALLLVIVIIGLKSCYEKKLENDIKEPQDIPFLQERPVALILGAGIRMDGQPSSILADRLKTGQKLLESGKVKKLILSGDNRFKTYNEPDAMKQYLIKKGVNETNLITDYAGRRTYDSCYRAKEIFGQQKIYVVTQKFHITRAVYLCQALGIDTIGVTSDLQPYRGMWLNVTRDHLSFAKAFLDIKILHPLPILGERVNVKFEEKQDEEDQL